MLVSEATLAAPRAVPSSTRTAGIAIAAATILSTVFVALDSGATGTTPLEILRGIAGLQLQKEIVHGVAIASVCAYAFGYATLARRLGLHRSQVLAGLTTFLLGCAAMIGATILDGFVTPHVAADAIAGSPERIQFGYQLIHYVGVILNDLAKLGWVLQAVGGLAWSLTLTGESRAARITGTIGVLSSVAVCGAVFMSPTNMGMTAILSVLIAQLSWNLAAAVWLMRGTRT